MTVGLALIFGGCGNRQDHQGKTPLVEVAGNFLYKEDFQLALPLNLKADDSLRFAEEYIRNWVQDMLLMDKAQDNVRDNDRLNALVENYRRTLVMHAYQEELVKQQLEEEITDEEVERYYENNQHAFVLEKPVVKGSFMKVPLNASGLADVRRWYKRNTPEYLEKMEKYSLRNAVTYDYFGNQWRPLEEVEAMMPDKARRMEIGLLKKERDFELKDSAYHYFLHLEEVRGKGEQSPLDFAKEEIKQILINTKRVEFINEVKEDLYEQALEKENIKYYDSNEKE